MNTHLTLMFIMLIVFFGTTKAYSDDVNLEAMRVCLNKNLSVCDEGDMKCRIKILHECVMSSKVTSFKHDVLPIVKEKCANCHNPGWKDKDFTDYKVAKENAGKIKTRAVIEKTMPPGNITGVTDEERETLGKWVDEGANP